MNYGKKHDLPFGIMDVAGLLRLNIRRRAPGQVYVDCPICGDRRGKMNLNTAKDLWRCNYCGEGGGMLSLYAKVYGVSNSDAYWSGVATLTGIYLIATLGVSILVGFTGLFSLGHAGFMAIGAYGTALSIKLLHMPFFPACLMGILAAMLAGGLIGRATLRLKGDYFVIATLAIGECTKLLIENIPSITGGSRGLTDIPKKTSLLLVWVILLAVIVILSNFLHSKHGRNCIAVREEELAAKSIGIDVIRYKMLAFLISCALCGLAGGLLAGYMGYLYPTMFTMAKSNELTMTVILGGTGSLTGTILAGLVLIPLPEYLRIESAEEWRMVLYGVLVVAVIVFKPSGLMGSKEFTVAGVLRRCKQLAARVRKRGSKRDKEGEAKK